MTMDTVLTQGATIGICMLGVAFMLVAGMAVTALVRKAKEKKTHEPYAGKTLGL